MKCFKSLFLAAVVILFAACKKDELNPISSEIEGPLGEYFEVINKDYNLNDGKVAIHIKRIQEGMPEPWVKGLKVGRTDGQYEPQFTVEFLDGDKLFLSKENTEIAKYKDVLNQIASLPLNDSLTITVPCVKDAVWFKLGSSFIMHGEVERTLNLGGSIGRYPVNMTLYIAPDGAVKGAYYYSRKGPGNYLYFKGKKNRERIGFTEFTKDGTQTGTFEGNLVNNKFVGHFSTRSGDYTFALEPTPMTTIDFSNIDYDSFYIQQKTYKEDNNVASDESYSSGSSDWDSLLDAYEQYVDKYISYVRKAANGDLSALAEYPALMEKASNFSSKLKKAEGDLSAAQWSRYIEITNKFSNAAQMMLQ